MLSDRHFKVRSGPSRLQSAIRIVHSEYLVGPTYQPPEAAIATHSFLTREYSVEFTERPDIVPVLHSGIEDHTVP